MDRDFFCIIRRLWVFSYECGPPPATVGLLRRMWVFSDKHGHSPIKMFNTIFGMWSRWWDARNRKGEIFLAVSVTMFVIVWSVIWRFVKKKSRADPLPPGPRGLPIVGYLPFLGTELHQKFTELGGVYGPIYKLWLGNKLYVVLNSPSLVKEVDRNKDKIFANHDPTIAALTISYGGNDIVFSSYGPKWLKLRKLLVREMHAKASLDASFGLRRREIMKSIKDVYSNKIGTPIKFGELTFVTVLNALTSMVWGDTLSNNVEEFGELVNEVMVLLGKPNVSDTFPLLAWFDIQGIAKEIKKLTNLCDQIYNSTIDQRIKLNAAKNEDRKDFLQLLLEMKDNEDAAKSITHTELKALLMNIVVGGMDTMATTMDWVMTELLLHPEVMKKVQEELTEVVGLNNTVEEFHLPTLQYLDAVVKEALRLHPPLPLVSRCPSQTSTVGRYTIPKGTNIFLNIWAIHRDPQLWDNPLKFQPERFLNDGRKWDYSGNSFQYLPFGSGRRICAGIPLAERMIMYVLASFLHLFEWKLSNGTELDLSEKFGIVLKKRKPLLVIPTPRLSNLELYA